MFAAFRADGDAGGRAERSPLPRGITYMISATKCPTIFSSSCFGYGGGTSFCLLWSLEVDRVTSIPTTAALQCGPDSGADLGSLSGLSEIWGKEFIMY